MGLFLFILVLGIGTSINVATSDDTVIDTPKEAYERVVSDIKEGYSKDSYRGFALNE